MYELSIFDSVLPITSSSEKNSNNVVGSYCSDCGYFISIDSTKYPYNDMCEKCQHNFYFTNFKIKNDNDCVSSYPLSDFNYTDKKLKSNIGESDSLNSNNTAFEYKSLKNNVFSFKDYDTIICDSLSLSSNYFGSDFFDFELTRFDCGGCTLCDYCNYEKKIRFSSEKFDLFEWFSDYDDFWYFDNKAENSKACNGKSLLNIHQYYKTDTIVVNSPGEDNNVFDNYAQTNIYEPVPIFENIDNNNNDCSTYTNDCGESEYSEDRLQ